MNTNHSLGGGHHPVSPGEATTEHEPSRDRPTSPGVPTGPTSDNRAVQSPSS